MARTTFEQKIKNREYCKKYYEKNRDILKKQKLAYYHSKKAKALKEFQDMLKEGDYGFIKTFKKITIRFD